MSVRTIAIRFPSPPSTADALRMAATTTAGATVGVVIAGATGMYNAAPVLVGIVLGLLSGSPHRRSVDALLAQGTLAVGLAALASQLFATNSPGVAWPLTLLAASVAINGAAGDDLRVRGRRVVGPAIAVGLAFLGAFVAADLIALNWMVTDVGFTAAAAAGIGVAGYLGDSLAGARYDASAEPAALLGERAAESSDAGEHASRGRQRRAPGRPAHGLSVPGGDGAARQRGARPAIDDAEFGAALRAFEARAASVEGLLTTLAEERPDEVYLLDDLREGVAGSVRDARDAVARWSLAGVHDEAERREALRARLTANRDRAAVEADVRLRGAISAAIARQERALAGLDEMRSARQRFRFRLEEAAAGLDVLHAAVARALTAGGELDHAEVDALVDALGEAQVFFETELEEAGVPAEGTSVYAEAVAPA